MAVRIRMKKMGRTHRPFFRICAFDQHAPRDGRPIEELGTYDTSVPETDARAIFDKERVDYWLSVGAQPSERCAVLIKKYGSSGTHIQQQEQALERLSSPKTIADPGAPASLPKKPEEAQSEATKPEETKAEAPVAEKSAAKEAKAETPAAEAPVAEKAPAAETSEAPAAEAAAEEAPTEEAPKSDD